MFKKGAPYWRKYTFFQYVTKSAVCVCLFLRFRTSWPGIPSSSQPNLPEGQRSAAHPTPDLHNSAAQEALHNHLHRWVGTGSRCSPSLWTLSDRTCQPLTLQRSLRIHGLRRGLWAAEQLWDLSGQALLFSAKMLKAKFIWLQAGMCADMAFQVEGQWLHPPVWPGRG